MNLPNLDQDLLQKLADLEAWKTEAERRRIPTAAIWTLVLTFACSAVSVVWNASAAYHEIAALHATVERWEPKLEELTKMAPLQARVEGLEERVQELQRQHQR